MKIRDDKIALRIVAPCYNEEDNIDIFYRRLSSIVQKYNYSILFIDDGSTDRTLSRLRALSKYDSGVFYLNLSRNFGQQSALKAGYDHSTDVDCVVSMDADLQHPPEIIDQLIEKWKDGFDVVNTVRLGNNRSALFKRISAKCFYKLINYISKTKIIPNGPDYRLLDKKVIKAISEINESNIYHKELIPWLGFRHCEVPFEIEKRQAGTSKYSFTKQLSTSIRGITSFSINPLRLSSLLGILFSLFSFLYGLYAIYAYLFTENVVPGWTSTIASMLLIAGIQFILIGIIGEYLGKTFLESKKRPLYIIDKTNLELPENNNEKSS